MRSKKKNRSQRSKKGRERKRQTRERQEVQPPSQIPSSTESIRPWYQSRLAGELVAALIRALLEIYRDWR